MKAIKKDDKLYIQAFREIRAYIIRNGLRPGDLLPTELDRGNMTLRLTAEEPMDADHMIDVCFLYGEPRVRREDDDVLFQQEGCFQLLYENSGVLKGTLIRTEGELCVKAGDHTTVNPSVRPVGTTQSSLNNSQSNLRADLGLNTVSTTEQGIPMVVGLSLGEMTQPDQDRPSMILRRSGGSVLWEIAKEAGSTVDEIVKLNHLQGEPDEDQLLLIPVL